MGASHAHAECADRRDWRARQQPGHDQPVPAISISPGHHYADGIIVRPNGMIRFLNLERMFEHVEKVAA
jgi:hypothetical protein